MSTGQAMRMPRREANRLVSCKMYKCLALLIAALRWIGILVFALLSGYFVTQDAYLESTISILTVLAWIAATTEALDLVLERYS